MKTESGLCEVWKFGCLRNRNTKDQKYKNKNKWLISKTQSWTFRPTVFVHTPTQTLMRSGKSSHKNNLSCCGHELTPVCLSSDEPSKSFSSQPSVQSHPGHYCTDKTCTHQGHDAAKWKYRPPSSSFCLLLLPPFSSSFFPVSPHGHISSLSRSLLAHWQQLVNPPTQTAVSLNMTLTLRSGAKISGKNISPLPWTWLVHRRCH